MMALSRFAQVVYYSWTGRDLGVLRKLGEMLV
jgi:hypothetical protein